MLKIGYTLISHRILSAQEAEAAFNIGGITINKVLDLSVCSLVPRLHPFLRSDSGEEVWSIKQTFLSQLWNFVTGVGMPILNCEYRYNDKLFYTADLSYCPVLYDEEPLQVS